MLAWLAFASSLMIGGASDAHVLDVPYRSQLDGSPYAQSNCGPASLAMALAFYGIDASLWDLRVRSMKAQQSWITDDGGYSDRYGVFVYNLASVAEDLGVHADGLWTREGGHLDRLHEWQPSEIRREVQADHPVIVEVAYRALPAHAGSVAIDDHYIVVHGTVGTDFIYSDPWGSGDLGPDEQISERELVAAMWRSSAPRAGFAVVRPRGG
jgi:uncharacterized protein YvpB